MNNQKLWEEYMKPIVVQFLKDKKIELEAKGYIPTIDLLLEDLEKEL